MGEPPEDPFAPLVAVHEDFVDKLTELEATLDEMMATARRAKETTSSSMRRSGSSRRN